MLTQPRSGSDCLISVAESEVQFASMVSRNVTKSQTGMNEKLKLRKEAELNEIVVLCVE